MAGSRKIFSNHCRLPASIVFFLQWGNLKYMTQDKHRAMLHWIYERMLFIFITFIRLERYPLVLRSPSVSLFISGLLSASTNNRWLIFTLCSLVKCSSARVEDGSGGWCTDVLGAYFFMFWPCCADRGILVPQPRIEPSPRQLECTVLATRPPGNSLLLLLFTFIYYVFLYLAAPGLSWGTWDLVPDQGWSPGPLHWEPGVLAAGPPGKCPRQDFTITFFSGNLRQPGILWDSKK